MHSIFHVWKRTAIAREIFEKFLKIFEKFNRKIVGIYFWERFFPKNRAFRNNIIFLQQFFLFGMGLNPRSPRRTPVLLSTVRKVTNADIRS